MAFWPGSAAGFGAWEGASPRRHAAMPPSKDLELGIRGPRFTLTVDELHKLAEHKDAATVESFGGPSGLAKSLCTDVDNGISKEEAEDNYQARERAYGKNVYPEPPMKSFFSLLIDACRDTTVIILFCAACASLILGVFAERTDPSINPCDTAKNTFYEPTYSGIPGWAEGSSILVAVLVVAFVTAANNYSKEKQFRSLNAVKNNRVIKVVRGGARHEISIYDVLVGDIVSLFTGDHVPADGVFVDGHNLETDESAITGESDSVPKSVEHPFLLAGCQVTSGQGTMLVTQVGARTERNSTTPPQIRPRPAPAPPRPLTRPALIGKIGAGAAVLTFVALTSIWAWRVAGCPNGFKWSQLTALLDFFIMGVTIIVVAVPEGLPLAVTISLAYSMRRMLADNNLVRHLEACETMGGATNICSDKTGTLTENRMTVVKMFVGGRQYDSVPEKRELPQPVLDAFNEGAAVNSNAYLSRKDNGVTEFVGNKTECALLVLLEKYGGDYEAARKSAKIEHLYAFSSEKKRMSVIVEKGRNQFRLLTKGASEAVLELCTSAVNADGSVGALSDRLRDSINASIDSMASSGLRTLVLAYRDLQGVSGRAAAAWEKEAPEEEMTFVALVGIKDPVRQEVPAAVAECRSAGIFVRMVTGDNKKTAMHIARECGIYHDDGVVLEGAEFRRLSDEQLDALLPRLQVLARATPTDKYKLVKRLRFLGEVVAVTGDGTNDAPALKEADVGLSMGISGTEVAKEASDIVLMDDNFTSIVNAVMWGRCVYENIRKFVQFQLTVNVVALVVAFVSAVTGMGRPLKPIQLLWVNMIMDTMGALALGTERPTRALLEREPYGRDDSLINYNMWKNIIGHSVYQLTVIFTLLYKGQSFFKAEIDGTYRDLYRNRLDQEYIPSALVNTVLFNTFVFCQLFNEFNCRKLGREFNILQGLFTNWLFLFIIAITIGFQVIIIELMGTWFDTIHLTLPLWGICIAIGFGSIPWGLLLRTIHIPEQRPPPGPAGPKPVVQKQQEIRRSLEELTRGRRQSEAGHVTPTVSGGGGQDGLAEVAAAREELLRALSNSAPAPRAPAGSGANGPSPRTVAPLETLPRSPSGSNREIGPGIAAHATALTGKVAGVKAPLLGDVADSSDDAFAGGRGRGSKPPSRRDSPHSSRSPRASRE
eukprot:tig00021234_g19380.t1